MRLSDLLKDAGRSIRTNKLRTALSVLGIVIGVGSVIALVSVGTGAQRQVTSQIASLGSNLITISPGNQFGRGSFQNLGGDDAIQIELAAELVQAAPSVKRVMPQHQANGRLIYAQTTMNATVLGVTEAFPEMMNYNVLVGRFIRPSDLEGLEPVIVLGSEVATTLFGETLPIGERVILNSSGRRLAFTVVGVMEPKGQVLFSNFDNQVYVPITTLLKRVVGGSTVNGFVAEAASTQQMDEAIAQLEYYLARRTGNPNRFRVSSQQSLLETLSSAIGTFSTMLAAIAGISLIVGGIGIMNIMLVSVTERTREIGLRKALGALRRDLVMQFLAEAVTLSLSGGVIGVLAGWGGSKAIERFAALPAAVSLPAVGVALVFSIAVGLVFGVYPAIRASRLDPVVALRHE